jgi:UDP-N-acetylglucosamine--N-acetylmuramyl-(pentapeptide) pyrophosphoryl-undecaprenol N-acetylglucosamine transferase
MKILLTGGGSGGHFYPVIAVAQSINNFAKDHKIADLKLYYMAPEPYNEKLLQENNITFIPIPAGKVRRYFSILNFTDVFKTGWGILKAIWILFRLYPDVVLERVDT